LLICSHFWHHVSQITQNVLHHLFYSLGAGAIEEARVQYGKGFGFVRYSNHTEAALAIQLGNGRIVGGKPIKVSICLPYLSFVGPFPPASFCISFGYCLPIVFLDITKI
jgi:hypothetical protein